MGERESGGKPGLFQVVWKVLLALLVLAGIVCWVLFWWNRFTLTVELEGEESVLHQYGEPFQDPGVRVTLRGTELLMEGRELSHADIMVFGGPNVEQLGRQNVTYHVRFLFWEAEVHRTVTVTDMISPVITLTKAPDFIPARGPYIESGYQAYDNLDGDITDRVKRQELPGKIVYTVVDSCGNPASVERKLPVFKLVEPEITLSGGDYWAIPTGTVFEEPGYKAKDDMDGDLTEKVQVEGEVSWWQTGTYPLVYSVTDSTDNTTTVTRNVEVIPREWPDTQWPEGKTIYLTFDDGPGPYTQALLNVLGAYGAKATFFVTDSGYGNVMREIVAQGHSIGIHTVTHDYGKIYASPEAFYEDLTHMQQIIFDETGVWTTLMRFPGGSSNLVSKRTSPGIMTTLSTSVRDAGYQYFDWNVDSDDAGAAHDAQKVFENVVAGVQNKAVCIVLQHDIHSYSVEAVENILQWGQENGYRFLGLNENSPGFHHDVLN